MNRTLSVLVTLAWGLWLGGIVAVTLSVIAVAKTFKPGIDPQFGLVAPNIFSMFERYQLGLAAVALIATVLWRLRPGAARLKTALFVLFAFATAGAVTETIYVAPKIRELRTSGQGATSQFDRAHKLSERIYGGTGLVLIAGGVVLVFAIRRDGEAVVKSEV